MVHDENRNKVSESSFLNILRISICINKTCLFKYTENFTTKKWKFEPPRQGSSNEYPQSMFLSRNKKNDVYPCKPQFY